MAAVPLVDATVFFANAHMRSLLSNILDKHESEFSALDVFLAGTGAGFAQTFIATPIEGIKIRLQAQENHSLYSGPKDCAQKLYKQGGVTRGLYKGFSE